MIKKLNKQTVQRLVTLGILIVICIFFSFASDKFLRFNNITNVLKQVSMTVIVASAVTMVMISGGMDLSVGGVMAFAGVVMAQAAVRGFPVWVCVIAGAIAGLSIGLVNGLLVVGTKMTPVIATIGTMYITRGLAFVVSGGISVTNNIPKGFDFVSRGAIASIPLLVIIMIIVFIIYWLILNRTLLGKYVYAIGGGEETARLSGINVGKTRFVLYILSGLMAGFAGALMASRLSAGDPNVGNGFEFDVIVAIVLGGTSLTGGIGSLTGTVIGALIVGVLSNGMNLVGVGSIYQYIIQGVVLILAVVVDMVLKSDKLKSKKIKKLATNNQIQ